MASTDTSEKTIRELEQMIERDFVTRPEIMNIHAEMLNRITCMASKSPLYSSIKETSDLDALSGIPITPYKKMHRMIEELGVEKVLLAPYKVMWQTFGSTGTPKRIYYSEEDLRAIVDMASEFAYIMGIRPGYIGWNFCGNDPLMNRLFFEMIGERADCHVLSTPTDNIKGIIKALKQVSNLEKIDGIIGPPWLFLLLERIMQDPDEWRSAMKDEVKKNIRFLGPLSGIASDVYLRGMDARKLKTLCQGMTFGFSSGEALAPYMNRINRSFSGIKFYDLFGSTEMPLQACQINPDMPELSYILYRVIPELADPADVVKSIEDKTYILKAVPWHKWERGMKGELIITREGESLPLIRYPTGDMIEVLDVSKESRIRLTNDEFVFSLPAVRLLGRSVDVVDFELPDHAGNFFTFKFYNNNINEALRKTDNVRWWEVYEIKGSPGRLVFLVIPEREVMDETVLKADLTRNLFSTLDMLDGMTLARAYIEGGRIGMREKGDQLDIIVTKPSAYECVEEEIRRRVKEGRSYGRLKPKRIYKVDSEEEFQLLIADKTN